MKIFFNRIPKSEPYGGGNQFLTSMIFALKESNHQITFNLEENIDVIFLMDPRPSDPQNISINEIIRYKLSHSKVKILHRVNECDARKNTNFMDSILLKSMLYSDKVIFISEWLQEYFKTKGFRGQSSVIYNGCDTEIFKPTKDPNLNMSKPKLVTHHWSDNWMKGFDIYTEIDKFLSKNPDAFEFTYVGRYYPDYSPTNTKIISPLYGEPLAEELKKHDIYVTASRWEPCGMHHVEGAASGLPILFHQDGGGINEMTAKYGYQYSNFSEFLTGFETIRNDIVGYRSKILHQELSIKNCCEKFKVAIESM